MRVRYTEEQKQEAIKMLEELGPAKTKEILGIPSTTIYRWKNRLAPLVPEDAMDELVAHLDDIPEEAKDEFDVDEEMNAAEDPKNEELNAKNEHNEFADRDSLVLGGILMKLRFMVQENKKLREENQKLRRAMLELLKGEL